jgi:hypothetical protein
LASEGYPLPGDAGFLGKVGETMTRQPIQTRWQGIFSTEQSRHGLDQSLIATAMSGVTGFTGNDDLDRFDFSGGVMTQP